MAWFPKPFLGPETQVVGGGGKAGGLSDNFIDILKKLLGTNEIGKLGMPGGDVGKAGGDIYSVLHDILKGADGNAGSAISKLLSTQQERDVNGLRARFGASGGQAYGTPAAYAESNYRAQAAPQITSAITGLQLQAIAPLLQSIMGISGRAIPQAQIVQSGGALNDILGVAKGVAGVAGAFANPWGGVAHTATSGYSPVNPGEIL